jgi:hypothetical protein
MTTNGSTPWQLSVSEEFTAMYAIYAAYNAVYPMGDEGAGFGTLNRRQTRYARAILLRPFRGYASQRGVLANHPSMPSCGLNIMLACQRVRDHVDKAKKRTTTRKIVSDKYPHVTLTDKKKVLRILVGMRRIAWTVYNKAVLESKASRASVVVVCV